MAAPIPLLAPVTKTIFDVEVVMRFSGFSSFGLIAPLTVLDLVVVGVDGVFGPGSIEPGTQSDAVGRRREPTGT
ncbi:hypothetical protein [Streptomyces sp. Tu102]|uniref:hypothetical protein n=1 Tax=Streptomyces sp. Tu102 TaxID=2838019 RepID=UPI001BDD62C5|nr:hypothetical protein [Streptomyces sp. Tu102]MBT1093334.1 hypothetical protein [Streptomyces sp. Tu102]